MLRGSSGSNPSSNPRVIPRIASTCAGVIPNPARACAWSCSLDLLRGDVPLRRAVAEDLGDLRERQVRRPVHPEGPHAVPVRREQPGGGDGRDVERRDPRERPVDGVRGGQHPGADPVEVHQQVAEEVAVAQVRDVRPRARSAAPRSRRARRSPRTRADPPRRRCSGTRRAGCGSCARRGPRTRPCAGTRRAGRRPASVGRPSTARRRRGWLRRRRRGRPGRPRRRRTPRAAPGSMRVASRASRVGRTPARTRSGASSEPTFPVGVVTTIFMRTSLRSAPDIGARERHGEVVGPGSPSGELSQAPVSVRPSGPSVAANRCAKPGASRHCRQTPSTRLDP